MVTKKEKRIEHSRPKIRQQIRLLCLWNVSNAIHSKCGWFWQKDTLTAVTVWQL